MSGARVQKVDVNPNATYQGQAPQGGGSLNYNEWNRGYDDEQRNHGRDLNISYGSPAYQEGWAASRQNLSRQGNPYGGSQRSGGVVLPTRPAGAPPAGALLPVAVGTRPAAPAAPTYGSKAELEAAMSKVGWRPAQQQQQQQQDTEWFAGWDDRHRGAPLAQGRSRAYEEGWMARGRGIPRDTNPYRQPGGGDLPWNPDGSLRMGRSSGGGLGSSDPGQMLMTMLMMKLLGSDDDD